MEKWMNYDGGKIPLGNYELIETIQNCDGTTIKLQSELHNIILKFEFVDSIRITDEGRRIKTYNEIPDIQKYRENFYGVPLYRVENSEYCKWLVQESAGIYTEFQHYVIITINDIVDVISDVPPKILVRNFQV